MKIKHFFPAAALALAMTACTADEMVSNPDSVEMPISFKAYYGNMTRAEASYDANNQPNDFKVWAFQETTDGFKTYFGTQTEYTTNSYENLSDNGDVYLRDSNTESWTTDSPNRYWPASPLNFFAIAGFLQNTGETKYGASIPMIGLQDAKLNAQFNYSPSATSTSQYDLMYAVKKNANSTEDNGKVKLEFKHLLSQICFEAKNEDELAAYQIKSVSLIDVTKDGVCTISNLMGDDDTSIEWAAQEGNSTTGNFTLSNLDTERTTEDENVEKCLHVLNKVNETGDNKTSSVNISNPSIKSENNGKPGYKEGADVYIGRALNMIPQNLSGKSIQVGYAKNDGSVTYATLNLSGSWTEGMRYVYTIVFKGDKITFETSFSPFTEESNNMDI